MLKMIVTGNLGDDAKFVKTEKNKFISFQLASGGDKPDWVDCSLNIKGDDEPKILEHLKKGKKVLCEGKPYAKVSVYENETRAKQCLFINTIELL